MNPTPAARLVAALLVITALALAATAAGWVAVGGPGSLGWALTCCAGAIIGAAAGFRLASPRR